MRRGLTTLILLGALLGFPLQALANAPGLSSDDATSVGMGTEYYDVSNPASCPGGGGGPTTLTGSNNEQQAFNYFVGKGLNDIQSAAILGNLMQESHVDPEDSEVDEQDHPDPAFSGSQGWGLAQWTPGVKILSEATKYHISGNIDSLATQLDLIWAEMQGTSPTGVTNTAQGITQYKTLADLQAATSYFTSAFEGPQIVGPRYTDALSALHDYGGAAPPPAGGPAPSGPSCGAGGSDISAYQNPLRDVQGLTQERIDQGVDYGGSGKVYAIGDGTVVNITNSGWPGGAFIVYQLTDGPAVGKYVYFGENCPPAVSIGDTVHTNTVICNMVDAWPNIETGWANGAHLGEAMAAGVWAGHDSTAYYTAFGQNFSQLLVKTGAPPGTIQPGAQELGTLPSGWPTW